MQCYRQQESEKVDALESDLLEQCTEEEVKELDRPKAKTLLRHSP